MPEWKVAVVLDVAADGVDIGLQPAKEGGGKVVAERARGRIAPDNMEWAYRSATADRKSTKSPVGVLNPGDVVYVEALEEGGSAYRLRQPPKVQGGLVAMDPPYRPCARARRWLLLLAIRVQPCDAGDAPAGLVLQALRLRSRTRYRLYPGFGHHGRPGRVRLRWPGWRPQNYGGGSAGRRLCAWVSKSHET